MALLRKLQALRAVASKPVAGDPLYLYQTSRSYCGKLSNGLELNSWKTYLCPIRGHYALPWIRSSTVSLSLINKMKDHAMALPYLHEPHKFPNTQTILSTSRSYSIQNLINDSFPEKPSATHYDNLINTAGHERDFDTLRDLLNKRAIDQVYNTSNTFKFITNTEVSLSILENLAQNLSRLENGFPRTSAFNALIARLCKIDQIAESLRIAKIMANSRYGLTNDSFYPILSSLTRKKKMDEAWGVMKVMEKEGVSPNITAFNYFLTAYCYIGDMEGTIMVLKKMEEAGLGADERTYDALLLGLCRAGKVEGALAMLRKMEDDGIHVLYSSYMHVINGFLKLGYFTQALKFVKIYGGRDVSLDADNFGTLAAKLIRLKRIEEAKLVMEEMEERGLVIGAKLNTKLPVSC